MPTAEMNTPPPIQEDRAAAILCYITVVGFIAAIIIHSNQKTAIGAFHLRQVLGCIVLGIATGVAAFISIFMMGFIPVIGPMFVFALWACLWVACPLVWLFGLITACQGKQTPVPLIGAPIQKWFANTFN